MLFEGRVPIGGSWRATALAAARPPIAGDNGRAMSPRVVIDQTSPEWDEALRRAMDLLAAAKGEVDLPELERILNDIVSSENGLNELANLVFALTLIAALATEFLSQNAGADFTEMLKRIEWLIEETLGQDRGKE